jgi:hypothetical protein
MYDSHFLSMFGDSLSFGAPRARTPRKRTRTGSKKAASKYTKTSRTAVIRVRRRGRLVNLRVNVWTKGSKQFYKTKKRFVPLKQSKLRKSKSSRKTLKRKSSSRKNMFGFGCGCGLNSGFNAFGDAHGMTSNLNQMYAPVLTSV